ncbi:hypothetical protein ACQP1V_27530 [Microtetraspora malaysiensis]|uniref:hypothetical protein n=1 Tax=Microtetraspora malaysiensis TaxID=161358 RepID=UPI003D948734
MKTGAADSAWLRDLQDKAQGDLSRVLLVSTDTDIKRACQEWRVPPPLMRNGAQLLETLFTFTLDDSDATVTRLIVTDLRHRLAQNPPGGPCGFTVTADPRQLAILADDALDDGRNGHLISAELTQLNHLAGIVDVSVQAPEPSPATPPGNGPSRPPTQAVTHTALATVFFLGTAEFLSRENGHLSTWRENDILVRVDMAFEIQDGGAVTSAESVREAALHQSTGFSDSSEALEAVCEALSTIPLLRFPDRWQDTEETVTVTGPGGVEVYVELERRGPWSSWTLTVLVGDDPAEQAELTCEQDDDAILDDSAGYGYHPDPPFVLRVSSGPIPHGNPAWGLAAWVMGQLPI